MVLGNADDAEERRISYRSSSWRRAPRTQRMACVSGGGDTQLESARSVKYIGGRTSSPLVCSTGCRAMTKRGPDSVKHSWCQGRVERCTASGISLALARVRSELFISYESGARHAQTKNAGKEHSSGSIGKPWSRTRTTRRRDQD